MDDTDLGLTEPITCGHCRNTAPMVIIASGEEVFEGDNEEWVGDELLPDADHIKYEVCKCPACQRVLFRKSSWSKSNYALPYIINVDYLYPQTSEAPPGVSDHVRVAYQNAQDVKQVNANAYAVMLGRVLELVCFDRGATGKDLYTQLENLANKGEIPKRVADIAQRLRKFRNVGAHASSVELSPSELSIMDNLIKAVLEYVYSAPHYMKLAEDRLAELKNAKKT